MMSVPVNAPNLGELEKKYLLECIDSGWISSEGPIVEKFESKFAEFVGRKHAVAVSSGSAALDVAVAALEIGSGCEVIVPTFTIISCASAVVRSGAMPILVDCESLTWNMDIGEIESKITPRTKAIMAVHIYGLPVDIDPVLELADKHGLSLIEDAAEMHGQTYKGKMCGSFGDLSVFSFYPNKNMTTGEGGMIVTDDDRLAERCRSLKNLCFKRERRFVHEELGWNYRMTSLQAAIGLAQLERIDESVKKKRYMGKRYTEALEGVQGLRLPLASTNYADNIYWVYGVVLDEEVPFDAGHAINTLGEKGIGARPFFWPMHLQPVFRNMGYFSDESYPVAEGIADRGFYIPSGIAITDEQIDYVCSCLRGLMNYR